MGKIVLSVAGNVEERMRDMRNGVIFEKMTGTTKTFFILCHQITSLVAIVGITTVMNTNRLSSGIRRIKRGEL
ncbi:MAG: hypothetical protein L0Y56_00665 [Nitrospira sp.]|nr:hypothetical protein [Nitrospira sp.]